MIKTLILQPGVTLRCFHDNRFKQGCLSFQLIRPMRAKEVALNALIPAVLLQGTEKYPGFCGASESGNSGEQYGASSWPAPR